VEEEEEEEEDVVVGDSTSGSKTTKLTTGWLGYPRPGYIPDTFTQMDTKN
jgi:hypothetical protein